MSARMREKQVSPSTAGGNGIQCSRDGKQSGDLRTLKPELLYELVNPLWGTYARRMKTLIEKDTCTPMFIPII